MPTIKEGQYIVRQFRGDWCIRQVKDLKPDGSYHIHGVPGEREYQHRDDAIKRMFELNGWRYRERK